MNKDLLDQQVKALRWSKEPGEIAYNAANTAQFCLQQLLIDDAALFSAYMEAQPEAQRMFGIIQDLAGRILETNLDRCDGTLRNRIAPKMEQARTGTRDYLQIIEEKGKKSEEILQCEEALRAIENETERLKKELESRKALVQELRELQKKLSECNMQQLEKELEEQEEKLKHEKAQRSTEEETERTLEKQLQSLENSMLAGSTQIEDLCSRIRQTSAAILDKQKKSENGRTQCLQKLEQRAQEYIECWEEIENIYPEAEKHLAENMQVAGQMASAKMASDAWRGQCDAVGDRLGKKLREFEAIYVFTKGHIDLAVQKGAAGKDKA